MKHMLLNVKRIEERRHELGLSMERAARLAGLPGRSYWHDVVSGRRANLTLATLEQIALALELDARELLNPTRHKRS